MIFRFISLAAIALLAAGFVAGHDRYILPSHTVLSGEEQNITLIASVSNDMFHADRPFGDNGKGVVPESLKGFFQTLSPVIIHPDGKCIETNIWQAFARFSVGDLALREPGTYRISLVQPDSHMTTFRKADGSPGRVFGKNAVVPDGAVEVVRRLTSSRVETFVTLNAPGRKALTPTGDGLELSGITHPNDLFTGESADFQLFYNGKALSAPANVTIVRGGTRHRNQRNPQEITTQADGRFQVTFKEAGFYLIQAEAVFKGSPGSGIDSRHAGLFLTVEVFPE
ncbi:MAG: DUF4198 domain-containing protein [Acidobacteriota bacterium]|nr:DUF4198 domain-containing protein [Acidobacteriota bacterium]